ncbi:MAG: hypothetical protein EOP24_32270 [Hyphomicrobiales bacterium]|nr:MAG: hypothetical protein EOP24_32270 [Hyphomicrobiales bacterium]
MSDQSPFGFGRFVPGFDFLQSLAKGSAAGMPAMSNWVAPTVSVEELDKRIEELKAVQFWLEQNSRALTATVQALEVQKMTLATLKGMNVAMGDLAEAFTGKAGAAEPAKPAPAPGSYFKPAAAGAATEPSAAASPGANAADDEPAPAAAPGVIDPMQWWSALGAQFQQIAANAMTDAGHSSALDTTREMAAEALKTATGMASQFAAQATGKAPAARKSGGTGVKDKAAGASRKRATAGSTKSAARPAAAAGAAAPRSKKPVAPRAPAKKAAAPVARGARRTGG